MTARYPLVINGTQIQELQSGDVVEGLEIGVDIQAYDADTAKYDDTTANFTGTLQKSGNDVLTTASTIAGGTY